MHIGQIQALMVLTRSLDFLFRGNPDSEMESLLSSSGVGLEREWWPAACEWELNLDANSRF